MKHAVTALSTGESYSYDANGNMTTRVEGGVTYTQTFDAENRLISITAGGLTTSFVYDGDGNLVKKLNPDNSRTIYVGSRYEVNKSSGGTVTSTKTYYPAGGAMRVDGTRYYVLKDHLASASVVTNQSATTVGEDRFYPFGETRFTTGNMKTDKLFTGQREMAGLGIYHYNARFYSPKLGRFLSADSIVPGYANPQNLNRFSYVGNNPMRYTDPTGHMRIENSGGGGNSACPLQKGNCVTKTTITVRKIKNNPRNNDVVGVPVPQPPGSSPVPTQTETTIVKKTTTTTIMDPVEERIVLYEDEDDRITIRVKPGVDLEDAPLIGPFDPEWVDPNTGERKDKVTLQISPLTGPSRTVTTLTQTNVTVTTYAQNGDVLSSVPTENVTSETHVEVAWGGGWVPEEVFLRTYQEMKRP